MLIEIFNAWPEFPPLYKEGEILITPEEHFFRDMLIQVNSWSAETTNKFIESLGYEPGDCWYENGEWVRELLMETFEALPLSNQRYIINEQKMQEFLE